MNKLSHIDEKGSMRMVDVGNKNPTQRVARARCRINLTHTTLKLISQGALPKGDALAVARLAGIMAAKRTPELIPLCHPLLLSSITINFIIETDSIIIEAIVAATASTGVEMEALISVSVAALALYDMIKSVENFAIIEKIWLEEKSGGKNNFFNQS